MNEESIFAAAVALKTDRERQAYLEQACSGQPELRSQVEALLKASADAGSFLSHPPVGIDATLAMTAADDTVNSGSWAVTMPFLTPCDKPGRMGKLVGEKTGEYEVIEIVGQGGMGAVLRSFETKLSRIVAVKVMAPELAANPTAVKRFLREATTAAAVHHDHVVTIHAIDEAHRPPFIVMQFIEGQNLQQKIDAEGALDLKQILRIGSQTAAGLAAAHKQGLIHRDVKPANILLENGVERVKITDFGLARAADDMEVTQTGIIAGTPQYMSPEQAKGEVIDTRSDLFSLGSVLYTMCTGRAGFRADTTMGVLRRVCEDTPRPIHEVNAEIPPWLEAIVNKLLAKNPADRFQKAGEVEELLGQHLAHLQNPAQVARPATVVVSPAAAPPARTPAEASVPVEWLTPALMGIPLMPALCLPLYWLFALGTPVFGQSLPAIVFAVGIFCGLLLVGVEVLSRLLRRRDEAERGGWLRPIVFASRSIAFSLAYLILAMQVSSYFMAPPPGKIMPGPRQGVLEFGLNDPRIEYRIDGYGANQTGVTSMQIPLEEGRHKIWLNLGDVELETVPFPISHGEWGTLEVTIDQKHAAATYNNMPLALRQIRGTLLKGVQDFTTKAGWTPLFNRQDLTGWKTHPRQPGNWRVEKGVLIGSGSVSHLFTERDDFEDFHLQAEVQIDRTGNSGIYFRSPLYLLFLDGKYPPAYEVQIYNNDSASSTDQYKTGSLHAKVVYPDVLVKGEDWFTLDIQVRGSHALVQVNGVTTVDTQMTADPYRKESRGHIALQSTGGTVRFRRVDIRELQPLPFPPASSADILTSSDWEWTEPVNLGPVFNSEHNDGEPTLSGDGLSLVFYSNREGGEGLDDLWLSTRPSLADSWTPPANLGPQVNSTETDGGAALSADGLTLIFHSNRPGGQGEADLWMSTRADAAQPWSKAVNLGAGVNSPAEEVAPTISADGLTLIFNSDRQGRHGQSDLWFSTRPSPEAPWSPAQNFGPGINSPAYQGFATLASDGLSLIFNSNGAGGPWSGPFRISTRTSPAAQWSPPKALWNDALGAWSACLAADHQTLLFDSKRVGSQGGFDLWMTRRVQKTRPVGSSADILTSAEWEWTEPENLGTAINSDKSEGGPTLSGDGLLLVFHSEREGGQGEGDLWFATRPSLVAPWTPAENLGAAINTADHECDACLSADALTLVFQSNHETGQAGNDVWISTRPDTKSPWSAAVKSCDNEAAPALSADGLTLVVNSGHKGSIGQTDLWMRTRASPAAAWTGPTNLGPRINSPASQGYATLASDGLSLIYNSNRAGGPYAGPLWIATRPTPDAEWSDPARLWQDTLGAWSPCLAADHQTLLFDSKRAGGLGEFDLWMSRRVRKSSRAMPPPKAIAPFDAEQAQAHQAAWAAHLGLPVEITNPLGMTFRLIPPGEFLMGSTPEEIEAARAASGYSSDQALSDALHSEGPQHRVILSEPFYLSTTEVTQKQFETVVGTNPSAEVSEKPSGEESAQHPVAGISWNDAADFCAKLSTRDGLIPAYRPVGTAVQMLPGNGYRMPREAQWEFACRAGSQTAFWFAESDQAAAEWLKPNAGGRTHAVGTLQCNPFGLFDMHGNVREWCQDGWNPEYYLSFKDRPAVDPLAKPQGPHLHMVRGGDWSSAPQVDARSASRRPGVPSQRYDNYGFRVTLSVEAARRLAQPAEPATAEPSLPSSEK